jgi:hypothetical protein
MSEITTGVADAEINELSPGPAVSGEMERALRDPNEPLSVHALLRRASTSATRRSAGTRKCARTSRARVAASTLSIWTRPRGSSSVRSAIG